ncbi:AraC family transcriptional regulator [Enterococcus sp. AZ196]|uniref:helix-turn-helix transcriptional regulator n=1 Tax=Enterococcus sp. AZ196 TaxID=2774659 RepID=UPI003D2650D3
MQNYFSQSYYYMDNYNLPFLKGIGIGHGDAHYFWENKDRKDHQVVLQYTLAGVGYFESGDQRSIQRRGSFFLAEIPSDCRYYGKEDWQFLYLEFSKEVLQLFYPINQTHHSSSPEFQELLIKLCAELKACSEVPFFENTQLAYSLILALKKELLTKRVEKYPLAKEIKKYLEQHYQSDVGLMDVEEQFGVSRYKAIRLFEKAYSISPMAYLKKYRIKRALPFLTDGQRTVHQIAQLVGMANGNYFAKVFKAEMGISPSDYQKSKQRFNEES